MLLSLLILALAWCMWEEGGNDIGSGVANETEDQVAGEGSDEPETE